MKNSRSADVIVVGLGAFGSATVYQLAARGVRVIGIDQFSPPHELGSSHGATRITRLAVGEGAAYVPIIKRSHEIWATLESATGRKLFHRTGGLIMGKPGGTVRHHGKSDFVQRTIENAERFGIQHEVLNADEIRRRYPQFLISDEEIAYFEPESGALVPEACVEVQCQQAIALGADLRLNEKVLDITDDGKTVEVRTFAGTYSAAKVIVTAGAWLPSMLEGSAMQGHLRVMRQTLHWFHTSEPALYAPERFPIFIWMYGTGDEDFIYGFPMVDGIAGVKVAAEQYHTTTQPDGYDRVVTKQEVDKMFAKHIDGRLATLQPRAVHSATCLYTVSTDAGFIVDRYRDMQNVTAVSACSGHGFKNSAGLGERLAMQVTGDIPPGSPDSLAEFSLDRLKL